MSAKAGRVRRRRRLTATICGLALVPVTVVGAMPAAAVSPTVTGPETVAAVSYTPPTPADLSSYSWTTAFHDLNIKLSREYAFTSWKSINWVALYLKYQPRIARAEADKNLDAYYLSLRDYVHELHDGHVSITANPGVTQKLVGGGLGMTITRLNTGAVVVNWVKPGGPADRAGIKVGAQIFCWNGKPVEAALNATSTVLGPSQPTAARIRSEQLRFLVRGSVGELKKIVFRNPGAAAVGGTQLRVVADNLETLIRTDNQSIIKTAGFPKKMVESRILTGNVGYVRINAEIDLPPQLPGDHTPTLTQFRAAIAAFINAKVSGIVVDVRANSGGSDQMVADFMASFYQRNAFYEYQNYIVPAIGKFEIWVADDVTGQYARPGQGLVIAPRVPRYTGPVIALVNNGCVSSGEGVAMGIKNLPRGKVVGFEGTNGSFGMVGAEALMPGGYLIGWPFGQSLDRNKVVQIDSRNGVGGVSPTNVVPMTLRNAIDSANGRDVVLAHGLSVLRQMWRSKVR